MTYAVGRYGLALYGVGDGDVAEPVDDPANLQVVIDGTTSQLSWDASPLLA